MPDLLLSTYAVVLTIPVLALLAFGAASLIGRERPKADDAGAEARVRLDPLAASRGNEALRSTLFAACLAAGTTASLLLSNELAPGALAIGGLAALSVLAGGCAWRLTRSPHDNPLAGVANALAWWLAFGFLAGLTAQVLIAGGLLSAAVLIALVGVAGANALSRDGGLAVRPDREGRRLGDGGGA